MALPDKNYSNKDFQFKGRMMLLLYGEKCAICNNKKDWMEIHHIDKMNNNNDFKNLIPVCKDCHMIVHSKKFSLKLKVDDDLLKLAFRIEEMILNPEKFI